VADHGLLAANRRAIGRAIDVDNFIRSLLLVTVFLVFSFHPFPSLAEPAEVTDAGSSLNQIGFSILLLVLAAWSFFHGPSRLKLLLRPILIAALLWCALCVLTSWDPSLSARRFIFALVILSIASIAMLLPKNVRHFSDVMAAVALFVLAVCYLGVLLFPSLSIHQATDYLDPELAGDWRGLFSHKNAASSAMVLFIFIGLFIARIRSMGLGALIITLASTFLLFTHSKTAIAMFPLALIASVLLARIRRPSVGIALALLVVVAFNFFSVGSIYFEPIRNVVDSILSDPTFTGRTDIWRFTIDHVAEHPITGYGFSAFWGTKQVVYGMGESATWANTAGHAHNSYINLAVTIGIPGAILVALWLVVVPLIDYYRSPRDAYAAPLQMLFLRVCLFVAFESCFEDTFFGVGWLWFFFIVSTFGLRFLSISRAAP
jgi:O-antigen ligase